MKFVCSFLFVLLVGFCQGGVSFQLDARKGVATTESNVVWSALQGMRVVGERAEWQRVDDGIVNVAGAEAGALVFEEGEGVVRSMVMVVRCGASLRMRETLICGERVFRLAGRPENEVSGNVVGRFERGGFCEVESWKVDGVEGAELEAGRTQLVEVVFPMGLTLSRMGLGSDVGRKEWRRAWGGGFCEVIGFDEVPSDSALAGMRHYLNLKWELGLEMGSTAAERSAASGAGVHLGKVFATLFMVR